MSSGARRINSYATAQHLLLPRFDNSTRLESTPYSSVFEMAIEFKLATLILKTATRTGTLNPLRDDEIIQNRK